ncbi:hypothetical protein [Argonema galeatum]|uniref:hypothetical protein n=1 Tax=Argonema galeatum TaxID=2942762 RepID=UPI002012AF9A|nr:hypothetical protein [Argonema galeatum]MCL1467399.1 hypothetical protein [Argonema galeatum A003/A1]
MAVRLSDRSLCEFLAMTIALPELWLEAKPFGKYYNNIKILLNIRNFQQYHVNLAKILTIPKQSKIPCQLKSQPHKTTLSWQPQVRVGGLRLYSRDFSR